MKAGIVGTLNWMAYQGGSDWAPREHQEGTQPSPGRELSRGGI